MLHESSEQVRWLYLAEVHLEAVIVAGPYNQVQKLERAG